MRNLVERASLRFADLFGSPGSLVLWCVLILIWLSAIPLFGVAHWNATLGLGGNTAESTIELVAEVAILIRAGRTDRRTADLEQQICDMEKAHGELLEAIAVKLGIGTP